MDDVSFGCRHIVFIEFLFISDLYYLEAFLDEVGGKLPQLFKAAVAVEDSRKVLLGVVGGNSEVVRHSVCFLLYGLCRDLFDGSVGVGKPYFVDVVQNVFARFVVVFSVALQDFMVAERVFERNERCIGLLLFADEEYKRFFAYKALVVIHSAYTMVQHIALMDEVCRASCDYADKGALLIVFKRQVFFGDTGKLFIQLLFRLPVCFRSRRGVLVYANVMPAFEVVRKAVLFF